MFALAVFLERIVLKRSAEAADEVLRDGKEHKTILVSVDAKAGTFFEIQFLLQELRQDNRASGADECGFRAHLIEA
jgi:hypothetical protein